MDNLEWEAHEYEYRHKTSDWYWAVGIIVVSLSIAFIFFQNFLFAIVILVGGFVLALHASRHPEIIHYELNRRGVVIDKNLYLYDSLESFWVEERDHNPRILIKSQKILMPYIILPLGDVMPETAHAYLGQYLKEEEHLEPIFQRMMEYLGF
jgi:hypothetical protein